MTAGFMDSVKPAKPGHVNQRRGGSILYILGGNMNWIYEFIEPKFITEQGCRFVFQPRRLLGLRYKSSKRSQIV